MSNTTLIIGNSGTGKSTSLRNLNPEETFIINVLDKPLPFRGGRSKYNVEAKNYHSSDDYRSIINYIKAIDERRPEIKVLIVDDFHYVLAHEFMNRISERGFDKYNELAYHAWLIFKTLNATRPDLYCFVLSHSDSGPDGTTKMKTIGKLLDEKINLEGMITCELHTQIVDGQYKFLTQNNGTHIAKTPMGMFSEPYIDNDLALIIETMKEYQN